MGRAEEKPGFMGSKWMTIVLIAVLVILAVALFLILRRPEGFEIFKKKKKVAPPTLKPGSTGMNQQFHNPNDRPKLESVDDRLKVVAELSWQKPVSPRPQV